MLFTDSHDISIVLRMKESHRGCPFTKVSFEFKADLRQAEISMQMTKQCVLITKKIVTRPVAQMPHSH